ncbi:MAG TPA: LPXTG cell wall anchor domain-containing protein [Micromonosporaceae bacterium]|nr:LPXTG cell wall anchor domain-containing protein [Micromonosporaceae bacterium]
MNSFLPSVRRLLIILAAIAAGIVGALALGSPTSAHQPFVEGVAVCDTAAGDWVVTWTVKNSENDLVGEVTGVRLTPDGTTVTDIEVDAVLPTSISSTPLTGVQHVPATFESASLTVDVHWNRGRGVDASHKGTVSFEGTCQATTPNPGASFASSCEGVVTVTLTNATDATAPAVFTVSGQGGFTQTSTVDAGKDAKVDVPKANAGAITVTEGANNTPVAEGKSMPVANCLPVTGVETGMYAAGGLALAGLGGVLFVFFRRRRFRFVS